ncbi:MAG: twin-arginine translocase subunit TatC [Desulfomonilia bacterium]|nr:twin-arginine translocase subunit TatC [Desulfomonilia bacterium]
MEEEKLPVTSHLEELRSRLIKCVVAVGVGFLAVYPFSKHVFNFLVSPLVKVMPEDGKLIYTSLPEAFLTYLKVSFFAGLILATPVIIYQIWKFVMPGLYENERRYVIPFVLVGTIFFFIGASFAFFVVFPLGFQFFLGFTTDNIAALPSMKEYLGFAMRLLFAFGVTFELPLVMYFLAKMGIVKPGMLRKQRKFAILIIALGSAVLTPPDVLSMILLSIPLYGLYEISIWVTHLVVRNKEVKDAEESGSENAEPEATDPEEKE